MKNIDELISYLRNGLVILSLFLSVPVHSAVIDITAEYKPNISEPGDIQFKNTTPVKGFCQDYPQYCPAGAFSVYFDDVLIKKRLATHAGSYRSVLLGATVDGRFKSVILTNRLTGETINAYFRLNLIDMTIYGTTFPQWYSGAVGGCESNTGLGFNTHYRTAWKTPEANNYCYRVYISSGRQVDDVFDIRGVGLGYELKVDSPLELSSGEYEGEIAFSLGEGGDIDYYAQSYSDNEVRFRIKATIQHAFNLQFPAGSNQVNLEPTGGWGQWLNYGRTPARLERNVQFGITTSNAMNVSLQCQHSVGSQCGLRNRDTGDLVGLETRVTLPGLKAADGSYAREAILTSDAVGQRFSPTQYVHQRNAQVHFRVNKPEVETMLKQPGSRWGGQVTLMFDAGL